MIKARASGSKVYLYFMKKGRQARHRIPRNSCIYFFIVKVIYIYIFNNAVPLQVGALTGYDDIMMSDLTLTFFLAAGNDVMNM